MVAKAHRVSEVARVAGITVRTLHHYDAIGLLTPSGRTSSGHRLYSDDDLLRLQQILIGRALGLSLEQVRRMLDDAAFDHRGALVRQRGQLQHRAEQTEAMIRAVDTALAALNRTGDETMKPEYLFDGFDPEEHRDESQRRWGSTGAYRESTRRTSEYGPDDWAMIKAEEAELMAALAECMQAGTAPTQKAPLDLAERHRLHIIEANALRQG